MVELTGTQKIRASNLNPLTQHLTTPSERTIHFDLFHAAWIQIHGLKKRGVSRESERSLFATEPSQDLHQFVGTRIHEWVKAFQFHRHETAKHCFRDQQLMAGRYRGTDLRSLQNHAQIQGIPLESAQLQ